MVARAVPVIVDLPNSSFAMSPSEVSSPTLPDVVCPRELLDDSLVDPVCKPLADARECVKADTARATRQNSTLDQVNEENVAVDLINPTHTKIPDEVDFDKVTVGITTSDPGEVRDLKESLFQGKDPLQSLGLTPQCCQLATMPTRIDIGVKQITTGLRCPSSPDFGKLCYHPVSTEDALIQPLGFLRQSSFAFSAFFHPSPVSYSILTSPYVPAHRHTPCRMLLSMTSVTPRRFTHLCLKNYCS